MNFGIDDMINKTLFGIPQKELEATLKKLKESDITKKHDDHQP